MRDKSPVSFDVSRIKSRYLSLSVFNLATIVKNVSVSKLKSVPRLKRPELDVVFATTPV